MENTFRMKEAAAASKSRISQTTKTAIGHFILHCVLLAFTFMFLFPLYWLLISSFKTQATIFTVPFEWLPEKWTIQNFTKGWEFLNGVTFGRIFFNTFYVTIVSVLATVFTASLVAFGFARLHFKGKNLMFILLLATMMLPSQVTLVPTYMIYNFLNLIDTFQSLYITSFFGGGAFFIFLIRQFIMGIPVDMDESARIDGASTFRIFWQIILPLCGPVIATVVIFSFTWTYNEFFTPLIFINSTDKFTVQLAIKSFVDDYGTGNIGGMIAMTTVSIIPLLVVFFLAQKKFVQGIMTTGLKG